MLVLKRKVGQTVVIGDHIRIKVVEVRSDRVRLAIEAPADVRVSFRDEAHPTLVPPKDGRHRQQERGRDGTQAEG